MQNFIKIINDNIACIILIILFLISSLLYFFDQRLVNVSTEQYVAFEGYEKIDAVFQEFPILSTNKISIVYFWQPYCPCDANVMPHFRALVEQYVDKNVEFLIADLSEQPQRFTVLEQQFPVKLIPMDIASELKKHITYTPSLGIWDKDKVFSYYGAHSSGAVCNVETSFIQKSLDSLLQGIGFTNTQTIGEGCFCSIRQ